MANKFILFLILILVFYSIDLFLPVTKDEQSDHQSEQLGDKTENNVIKESTARQKGATEEGKIPSSRQKDETTNQTDDEEAVFFEQADALVVGLGDSLILGVGDPTGEGYIGIVEKRLEEESNLNISVKNFGKRGQRSDQLLKTLKKEKVRQSIIHADLIFISIGGNDVMNVLRNNFFDLDMQLFEDENEGFLNNLRSAFQLIREINANAPIYMIGLFNPFFPYFQEIAEIEEVIQIWNEKSRYVASNFSDIHFVSIDAIFKNSQETLLYKDYFHPNHEGYQLIAEKVLFTMSLENDFTF